MRNNKIVNMVESQTIASITNPSLILKAIQSDANIAFLLTGNLLTLGDYVDKLHVGNMKVFIHLDFVEGLASTKSAIKYIVKECKPEGIISTKSHLIRFAKDEGLLTIQRIFLIDHNAISKGKEMIQSCKPDAVEVLPGLMPRIIYNLTEDLPFPVIAGGLVVEKEEVLEALKAGALAVSGGSPDLWNLGL